MSNYDMRMYDEQIKIKSNHDIIVRWDSGQWKEKTIFQNLSTGKRVQGCLIGSIVRENIPYFVVHKGKKMKLIATYWEATSDSKFLCCIIASLDLKRIKKDEIRDWKEIERYYFSPQKEIIVDSSYNLGNKTLDENHRIITEPKLENLNYDFRDYHLIDDLNEEFEELFSKELKKVFAPIVIGTGKYILNISNVRSFSDYIFQKRVKGRVPPKRILKLLEHELEDISNRNIATSICVSDYTSHIRGVNIFSILEKVNEKVACVRTFGYLNRKTSIFDKCYTELFRIYVTDSFSGFIKTDNLGGWIVDSKDSASIFCRNKFIDFEKERLNDTILVYAADIIDGAKEEDKYNVIRTLLRRPIFEQLYKGGLNKIIDYCFTFHDPVKMFNEITKCDLKKDNFYSILGINKHQLDEFKKKWDYEDYLYKKYKAKGGPSSYWFNQIAKVKSLFGKNNISDIDNYTFDKILEYSSAKFPYNYLADESMRIIVELYGYKVASDMVDIIIKYKDKKVVAGGCGMFSSSFLGMYYDYLIMIKRIRCENIFKPYFKDLEDFKRIHEEVLALYNAKVDSFRREGFEKATKRVLKYVYNDENYSIVVPKEPEDLVREGKELSHCVKSYIDRVVDGKTNILFLRKTGDIDTPFFTIELSNEGIVEQVHGFANRNASTEPDMLYFLENWINEKDLKKNSYDKVR